MAVSHTTFAVWFCGALYCICNALNLDKLARWFPGKDGHDLLALGAYLLAGQCLFLAVFVLMAHPKTIKPVAALLVVASASATYFISKYDVAIDSSMVLNTIHTDPTEIGQLLSARMVPYVVLLIAVPLAIVARVKITFASRGRYLLASLTVFVACVVLAVIALFSNYNAIHRAGNVSKKYIVYSLVPINVISGTVSAVGKLVKPYLKPKRMAPIQGRLRDREDLVVVLAIGESSRRRSFSLYGYERQQTNPVLSTFDGLHLLNGLARRGSTLYALPEILERDGVKLPQLTSRLGVPTACYVNFTLYDNCAEPGETKVSDCGHEGTCYDEDVLPLLDDDLAAYESGPRLVVLHLGGGSHGPVYRDRHPPELERFQPGCRDADVANRCTLEELYNSYDNTILYADFVLGEVLARLDRSGVPYVMIYLSDHGESLMEEGRMFHGMPPGVSLPPEQAEIPLIVKASVPIDVVERSQYVQQDVFDTVVELLAIESPIADRERSFLRRRDAGAARGKDGN